MSRANSDAPAARRRMLGLWRAEHSVGSLRMAPRPNWKGYLKLSLVSCAVALYPATTTSERVSFRTLNRATGNRVRRQFVDEASGEPVESDEQVKGYEVAKNEFITVED